MESVRTIGRGLAVMNFLHRQGRSTGSHVASQLGLSRPSTYRILETLQACGVVRHCERDNSYVLDWLAATLSGGFTSRERVVNIATPVLHELQQELLWPTDLATHENGEMVIHETTHPVSPYSIEARTGGSRHPILSGSLGRAYLSFCPDREREEILRHFLKRCSGGREELSTTRHIDWVVRQTRADGYGSRHREFNAKTSSIALPIRSEGRVAACMSVNWISVAMPLATAVERLLPPLARAVETVEQRLAESAPGVDDGAALASAA